MPISDGLIEKLVAAGAVERGQEELKFTARFCSHLTGCNPSQYLKAGEAKGWRIMLRYFNPVLGSLSDAEISKTICLFAYFLNNSRDTTTSLQARLDQ